MTRRGGFGAVNAPMVAMRRLAASMLLLAAPLSCGGRSIGDCGWGSFDASPVSLRAGEWLSVRARDLRACDEGSGAVHPITVADGRRLHLDIAAAPAPSSTPTAEPLFPVVRRSWAFARWDAGRGGFEARAPAPNLPPGHYVVVVRESIVPLKSRQFLIVGSR